MVYRYCEKENFEDLASGRVILHRGGYPNFPVRLAQEIFRRCLRRLDDPKRVCLYDPCCGGGYLLTVLGFLNPDSIGRIVASDINPEAVGLARENLSLLQKDGLRRRVRQLEELLRLHQKSSHQEALESAARLWDLLEQAPWEIPHHVFQADVLGHSSLKGQNFQADVIFADVPYGNLVAWQGQSGEPANLLDQLLPVTREGSVVAICSDKSQKFHSQHFQRMEKQQAGKRLFQIFTVLPKSGREAG